MKWSFTAFYDRSKAFLFVLYWFWVEESLLEHFIKVRLRVLKLELLFVF